MRNIPIFKKLAQLFLKHYVGQQNMSVSCQLVTFVLKHNHCSLTGSVCLCLANFLLFLTTAEGMELSSLPSHLYHVLYLCWLVTPPAAALCWEF